MSGVRSPSHWADPIKTSILAIDDSQYAQLTESERSNIETFSSYAKRYQHRLAFPLSKDRFQDGLETRLKDSSVKFARVPFRSIDTVYYLFKDLDSVKLMMDFVSTTADNTAQKQDQLVH